MPNCKYSDFRLKYKLGGINESVFCYLKEKEKPVTPRVLECLKIFYLPYVLRFLGKPTTEIHTEIERSYKKVTHHFELMCLDLGYEMKFIAPSQTAMEDEAPTEDEEAMKDEAPEDPFESLGSLSDIRF